MFAVVDDRYSIKQDQRQPRRKVVTRVNYSSVRVQVVAILAGGRFDDSHLLQYISVTDHLGDDLDLSVTVTYHRLFHLLVDLSGHSHVLPDENTHGRI